MIRGIDIQYFRGVAEAHLSEFKTLNIFVGPNASGKSTVLEALYIVASESPSAPLVVNRLESKTDPFRWWFYQGQAERGFKLDLHIEPSENYDPLIRYWCKRAVYYEELTIEIGSPRGVSEQDYSLQQLKKQAEDLEESSRHSRVRFVDVRSERVSLPMLYTQATRAGLRQSVNNLIQSLVPGSTGIEILTSADGGPELNVSFAESAIPVALMGDGLVSLVRQCLELASQPGGVIFMEEPEAFKHPAAIGKVASAIAEATRRDTQVFLTTHSLELIDALLEAMGEPGLAELAVFRMRLQAGKLMSSRFSGAQAIELREAIHEDLR